MLDTSNEFEFVFENVICTNLLLRDHKKQFDCSSILGLFDKELTSKLTGLKKTVRVIHGIRAIRVRDSEIRL